MAAALLILVTGLAQIAPTFAAAPAGSHPMDVALIAETLSPRPGSEVLVGLTMRPKAGWHGYWSNAGDSGLPPKVRWTAPPGVHFGALHHPAPTLLRVMGLTSYVHSGPHVLTARMTVDRAVAKGTPLPLTAEVSFAVCSDRLCVPQHATLMLQTTAGDGKLSADAPLLQRARAEEPKIVAAGLFTVDKGQLTLEFPAAARLDAATTHFFPDENGWFDPTKARTLPGSPLHIVYPISAAPPATITGVVSDGRNAFRLSFKRGALADLAPIAQPADGGRTEIPRAASPHPAAIVFASQGTARRRQPHQSPSWDARPASAWLGGVLIAAAALGFLLLVAVLRRRRP